MSNDNQDEKQPLAYFFAKSNFGDNQPDFIKIGHTITDISKPQTNLKRLKTLQTGNEAKIWDIGVIPFDTPDDASREEKRLQSQFGAFRAEGEWFIATPRILKFIKNYAVQHTDLFTEEEPTEIEKPTETEEPTKTEETKEMSFGDRLAEARKSAGMSSQKDLAEKVGYSRSHIALIEQDRGKPGKSLYKKLVELFGDSLEPPTETISGNILAVKMEDGSWISEYKEIDTFIEVIKTIGIERVKELNKKEAGIPLIADKQYPDKRQKKVETETGTYYIFAGLANVRKKKILDNIAVRLKRDIKVFINQVKSI